MRILIGVCFGLALTGADLAEERWPQFRGPNSRGIGSDQAMLPAAFGPSKALLWKTALPLGHGSPCIWGNRIFVTAFDSVAKKLEVIAVDRKSGSIVWRSPVPAAEIEAVHGQSSPATSTPVTDGELVFVYAGSFGLAAYRWNGKLAWEHPMGVAKSPYGSGASPLLHGDLILMARDFPPEPYFLAVSKKDGKVVWKVELPKSSQPGPKTSHATPVSFGGQVVLNRPGEVAGYAPADGKRLWWVPVGSAGTSTPSPGSGALYVTAYNMGADPAGAVALPPYADALAKYDADKDGKLSANEAPPNDLYFRRRAGMPDNIPGAHFTIKLFFRFIDQNQDGFVSETEYNGVSGFFGRGGAGPAHGLLAIRPSGEGDQTSALAWSEPRSVPEVSAPLEYRGRVYMVTAGGIFTCVDAISGKVIYRGRVNAPGAYYASPVAAGGKIFVASAEGIVSVLGGGNELEVLANNDLGEPVYGTPAPVGSALYVRSARHLWAFGGQ